jgi:methionyl-tRNA formyltransferase
MAETLRGLAAGTIAPKQQNHAEASYAPILKKEDGRIDWKRPASEIYNRMRGFQPWPGAYSSFRGQSCNLRGELAPGEVSDAAPGTILVKKNELLVVCGDATVLRLLTVKVEGRKEVSAAEFANGARLQSGERFGHS